MVSLTGQEHLHLNLFLFCKYFAVVSRYSTTYKSCDSPTQRIYLYVLCLQVAARGCCKEHLWVAFVFMNFRHIGIVQSVDVKLCLLEVA